LTAHFLLGAIWLLPYLVLLALETDFHISCHLTSLKFIASTPSTSLKETQHYNGREGTVVTLRSLKRDAIDTLYMEIR